jgi:hypothetical protein
METIFKELWKFQYNCTPELFQEIFGNNMGSHLWDRFSFEEDRNLLNFHKGLDDDNRLRLTEYLKKQFGLVCNNDLR